MNEEEKKAIEILKTNPKTILDLIVLDEKLLDKLSEFENYSVEEVKDWACETVLKLITKLQKENEELKTTVNKQSIDISNNLIELQQKDRQIDLMAKAFKQDDVRTVEEIKQYFETKAKGE